MAEEKKGSNFDLKKYKSYLLWGAPLATLVILIILLIQQITGGPDKELVYEDFENLESVEVVEETQEPENTEEEEPQSEEEVVMENDEEMEEKVVEEPIEIELTEEEKAAIEQEQEQASNEEVYTQSYITEEGDNLWSIAAKSDLNNPYSWKTILVQNKDKINYTIVSEDSGEWKVFIDSGQKLKIKTDEDKNDKRTFVQKGKKKYALQMMSLGADKIEKAVSIVKFLIQDGYYAYLYRTKTPIKHSQSQPAQYFYRIRTGFYDNAREAKKVGAEIVKRYKDKNVFPDNYWPVLPSYSELSGELIDFGIQRSKPWVVQLSTRNRRSKAIKDLQKVVPFSEFVYISQKKSEDGFQFRTRIGFFEKEGEGNRFLQKLQGKFPGEFDDAKILEVDVLAEAAPGQQTGSASTKTIPR